jgi:hypothetical protein
MKRICSTRTSKTAIRKTLQDIERNEMMGIQLIRKAESYLRKIIKNGTTDLTDDELDRLINMTASNKLKSRLKVTIGSTRARRFR